MTSGTQDTSELARQVRAVRTFNRFYTRLIGLLEEGMLDSEFSLTEVRVLYELAHHDDLTAATLGRTLGLDPGYLSRILKKFSARGFLSRATSERDARESVLALTTAGRHAFAPLNQTSHDQITGLLAPRSAVDRRRLVAAMDEVQQVLGTAAPEPSPIVLRPPEPGDMGWIIQRHGALYAREYGWDESFEALVAKIAAAFVDSHDPKRERCWIAEKDGEKVGSVFVVREDETTAKLRLLLVDPKARGCGIGRRLVDQCIQFSRARGYRTLTLWTNDVLSSARRIYVAAGFKLIAEAPHHSFGHDLVGETWALDL